jgi:predicted small lipoprotein YifL
MPLTPPSTAPPEHPRTVPHLRRSIVALAALSIAAGCGSKTGVELPDASPDAGVDAGPPRERCIEVPDPTQPVLVDFTLPVSLAVVDVFFLIDATASMEDEIENVREGLAGLVVPGVRAAIPDAQFGLAYLGEFPVEPHGPPDVRPYELRNTMTDDISSLEANLALVPSWGNFDDPEAQVEALYQVVTGEGLDGFIEPSLGCPRGGRGAACFREDSLPVVVLVTDAPFHNGPDGANPYESVSPPPHTYRALIRVLDEADILVVGLGATDTGRPSPLSHLQRLARDTGAVSGDAPLAFDIGSRGDEVGQGIVDAVQRLAAGLPLDVDAIVEDVGGDELDARVIVSAVRPSRADPMDGVDEILPDRFAGVTPGTRVVFEVVIDASSVPVSETTIFVPARIVFRAFGRSRLGTEQFVIAIGGEEGCEP